MQKKIAMITMVKDECDILELFIRINSRIADHIYIVDHNSSDSTLLIAIAMKTEGYPISIFRNEAIDFNQSSVIATLLRELAIKNEFAYLIPMDADEFISVDKSVLLETLEEQLQPMHYANIRWKTYLPTNTDYFNSTSPLYHCFKAKAKQSLSLHKIIIPCELGKVCQIGEGNHFAALNYYLLPSVNLDVDLQHVPVRSAQQLIRKILNGAHLLSIKPKRGRHEGKHWDYMLKRLRESNFSLDSDLLMQLAAQYGQIEDVENVNAEVDPTSPEIGLSSDQIIYPEYASINLTASADKLLSSLCTLVNQVRNPDSSESKKLNT